MRRTQICFAGACFLAITAFIVGGAMIREINLLLAVAGILFGTFLLSLRLLVRTMSRLEVDRTLPRAVGAGEPFTMRVRITNRKRRLGAWGIIVPCEVRKQIPEPDQTPSLTNLFFPFVGAKSTAEEICDCRIRDRGVYRFAPLQIVTRFPLGLCRRTLNVGEPATVFVYPQLGRIGPAWLDVLQSRHTGTRRSQHRMGLTEGEFHGLRNWRDGDSPGWIHWRTTARRNRLTVRQFERQRHQDLAILLELRDEHSTSELVERAVRFAATVIAFHARQGRSKLILGIAGQTREIVDGNSSAGLMRGCLESLAMAAASRQDQLPALVCELLPRVDLDTRIVAISTRPIDFRDTRRFSEIWDQPQYRQLLSRILCLSADEASLSPYFHDLDSVGSTSPAEVVSP